MDLWLTRRASLQESRNTERITKTTNLPGSINYDASSIAITAIKYNVIREEDVEAQGLLDGITWEEYKLANEGRTKLEVDEDLVSVVANARLTVPTL